MLVEDELNSLKLLFNGTTSLVIILKFRYIELKKRIENYPRKVHELDQFE